MLCRVEAPLPPAVGGIDSRLYSGSTAFANFSIDFRIHSLVIFLLMLYVITNWIMFLVYCHF